MHGTNLVRRLRVSAPLAVLAAIAWGQGLSGQTPPPPPTASTVAASVDTASATAARQPPSEADSVFLRAQRMAAEGQGDAARALVQHELDAAPAGSEHYVEALYWRAVVAATAADAERDLRAIIIDYPLAGRADDALMRLAQLEMTRGDNDQALTHLERVVVEHPDSPSRARASFWMARVLFDQRKPADACRRLADAEAHTTAAQVEQKNQIEFWQQRCVGVDTSAVAAASPAPATAASKSATPPSKAPTAAAPAAVGAGAANAPVANAPAAKAPPPKAPSTPAAKTTTQYTVQVAAYDSRGAAEELRTALAGRGFNARVVGTSKPFRVRVGRYDTRAQADSIASAMKAKKLSVYVTEAEPR